MKRRRILFIRLSQFKIFIRKVLIAIVFVSALAFMMLSKADTVVLNKTTGAVSAVLSPIVRVMQFPGQLIYAGYEKVRDIARVYADNQKLKLENLKVLSLKNEIRTLKIENKLLADMLNYNPPADARFITAKVVAEEGDGFSHSLIVYVGENNNVYKGQVVLGNDSVVGRINYVSGKYAGILLVTDIASKIPVVIERNRERGILSGDNTLQPKLLFTSLNADIKKGDMIVTSGVAGVFPSGLPVGVVSFVSKDEIKVRPTTDIGKLEYVKIVDYGVYQDVVKVLQENKGN